MKSKTEAEKSHLQKVADIGCIVCRNCGRFGVPAEVRHIRNGAGAGCGRLADCAEGELQTAFAEGVMRTLVLLHEKGLIKL